MWMLFKNWMCTINCFYSIIFYHCIRHAILLSVVLTLLGVVLSAILYNFNEWVNEWMIEMCLFHYHMWFGILPSMSTDLIKQRISELGILPELTGIGESGSTEISTRFISQMFKKVYPLISGLDHDRLVYFYTLLADCEASDSSAQNHIRLLKKLKSTAAGWHCIIIVIIGIIIIILIFIVVFVCWRLLLN